MSLPSVLLVGCGRMGSAMLAGWREQGLAPSIAVDPAPESLRHAAADLMVVPDARGIPEGFVPSAVVIAVKPQNAAETLPQGAIILCHSTVSPQEIRDLAAEAESRGFRLVDAPVSGGDQPPQNNDLPPME